MKKRIFATALCLLICLSACADPTEFSDKEKLSSGYERNSDISVTYNFADGAQEAPYAYNNYANYITNFELKLFRKAYTADSESFAIAPINSVMQLAMLANGAKNDTKQEITLALGGDLDVDTVNTCSSYFKSRIESVSKLGDEQTDELSDKKHESAEFIKLSNALFINNETDIRSAFLQKNADFFGADIFRFSFADENADSKLKNAGYQLKIDENQSMLAMSKLEFSDSWLLPYGSNSMTNKDFNGKTTTFMSSQECTMKSESACGIVKYTAKNPLKTLIIMPNEGTSLSSYIKTFDSVEYNKLLDSIDYTKRKTVQVPQFEIASQKIEMSEILQKSGLYTLFGEDSDFGNMAHTEGLVFNKYYDSIPSLYFSAMGLSTASASAATADTASVLYTNEDSEKSDLTFDRPFIVIIADNETNIPIYIGTYGVN